METTVWLAMRNTRRQIDCTDGLEEESENEFCTFSPLHCFRLQQMRWIASHVLA
jgi:hypothetical protein